LVSYNNLLKTTIEMTYPKYLQDKLKKILEGKSIISSTDNLFTLTDTAAKVSDSDTLLHQLLDALEKQPDATIAALEDMEYFNPYKYATLFTYENYNDEILDKMIDNQLVIRYDEKQCDVCCDITNSGLTIKPTYRKISEDIDCLKFNIELKGFIPLTENGTRLIKYPILALIHKNLNTVEIRLDKVKGLFKNNDEYFYTKQMSYVRDWIVQYLKLEIEAVNLPPVIEFLIPKLNENDQNVVKVAAQAMNLAKGLKAILDTGISDEFVLPLLGELKNLIKDNVDLFKSNDKTMEINELLENFILETEESASLPWISLAWTHEKKSKAVKVKFSFNSEFTLLQYYGNNAEMERMNNVTKYLIDNQNEYLRQEA
jgi:hypothetical protein